VELMPTYTDPNCSDLTGPNRILHVPFAAGTIFRRRGGKAVDLHNRYNAATANSSNLAGFAEVEDVGVAGGKPDSVSADDALPVNFALEKACVFPTSGGVVATQANRGKDYDIYVDANGVQYLDLNSQTNQVLRLSQLASRDGLHVSVTIPPDLRYGNV